MGQCCSKPNRDNLNDVKLSTTPNNQSAYFETNNDMETASDFVGYNPVDIPTQVRPELEISRHTDSQPHTQRDLRTAIQEDSHSISAISIENTDERPRETPLLLSFIDQEKKDVDIHLNERCLTCAENYNEQKKQPRILPCGHIICNECINNMARQTQFTTIQCPQDSNIFRVTVREGSGSEPQMSQADRDIAGNILIPSGNTMLEHSFPIPRTMQIHDDLQNEHLNSSVGTITWTEELLLSLQYEDREFADIISRNETENVESGSTRNPFDNVSESIHFGDRTPYRPFSSGENQFFPRYLPNENVDLDNSSLGEPIFTREHLSPSHYARALPPDHFYPIDTQNDESGIRRNPNLNFIGSIHFSGRTSNHPISNTENPLNPRYLPDEHLNDSVSSFRLPISPQVHLPPIHYGGALPRGHVHMIETENDELENPRNRSENISDLVNPSNGQITPSRFVERNGEESRAKPLDISFICQERRDKNIYLNNRCPVCLEEYNDHQKLPMILPCGHILCKECLFRLAGQNQYKNVLCPQDRQNFNLK